MKLQEAFDESIRNYFDGNELSESKPKNGKKFKYTKKYFDEFMETKVGKELKDEQD